MTSRGQSSPYQSLLDQYSPGPASPVSAPSPVAHLLSFTAPYDHFEEIFDDFSSNLTTSRTLTFDDDSGAGHFAKPYPPKRSQLTSSVKNVPSGSASMSRVPPPSSLSSAGAVDESLFIRSFEAVAKVNFFSSRELAEHITKIKDTLSEQNENWEKRVTMLKSLRSLIMQGATDHDDFQQQLRTLQPCLLNAVKDLRSTVVREACITLAYLSQQLGNKFEHCAENLLQTLINLIPNSAKVMSSSGIICIRFIIQNTHSPRLIPVITSSLSSKSSIIRKHTSEFLHIMLRSWPTHILEKHIAALQEAIRRGISDADSDARAFSRKAFWGFSEHFKDQADYLMHTLEPSKKRMLEGEMSNSSSNNSINSTDNYRTPSHRGRVRSASVERSAMDYTDMRYMPHGHRNFSSAKSDCGDADRERDLTLSSSSSTKGMYETRSLARPVKTLTKQRNVVSSTLATPRSNSVSNLTNQSIPLTAGRPMAAKFSGSSCGSSSSTLQNYSVGSTRSLPRGKSTTTPNSKYGAGSSSGRYGTIATPDRSRIRSKASQSQPTSRSTSPSSRLSYLTHNAHSNATPGKRIPGFRSQGSSRDTSPHRGTTERRLSSNSNKASGRVPIHKAGVLGQRMIAKTSDVEQAVADALKGPSSRRRNETYDSDDAASETSSICSDNSFRSFSHAPTEDVSDIITNLNSGSYADRKDGLLALQHIITAQYVTLSRTELKKITEIFTRMFHDPNNKVVSAYFETLPIIVSVYHVELTDWLHILIPRLLTKMGTELLPSLMVRAQKALDSIRDSFASDCQFTNIMHFITDQSQSPTSKTKITLLHYLQSLTQRMDPNDLPAVSNADTNVALSRIIQWTAEPKSQDVRKGARAVLVALFNLNPSEFSQMLSHLPKAFQDTATKELNNHQRSMSLKSEVLSPQSITSPTGRVRQTSRTRMSLDRNDDPETENMNPEEIYNSIRQTTADIQNLSLNSSSGEMKLDRYSNNQRKQEFNSQDSGIQDLRLDSPEDNRKQNFHLNNHQSAKNNVTGAMYDMNNDLFNEVLPDDQNEVISQILRELSNHNKRNVERKNAMSVLQRYTRENTFQLWDEHYKTILLILLETLGDKDGHIRAMSLRTLSEILKHQPHRFHEYAELTILRILEAHKDLDKEVVKSAEECASTFATTIPADQSLRILNSMLQTETYPVLLAAIKMLTKVIEQLTNEFLTADCLNELVPGILKGYDNTESSVRKASVFCLVALHKIIKENLDPYLMSISSGKRKLVNLYIKRSEAQGASGKTTPIEPF